MAEHPYVPAKWQKPRRSGSVVELIVIHSMEAAEKSTTAEGCAQVFKRGTRQASAHRCVDNDSIVECVHLDRYAYGAGGGIGSRRINDCAIHWEHAGYARQTAADWADAYSTAMLKLSAADTADVARTLHIQPVFRTIADLRAGQWNGFTDHATIEKAFPSTGHWDPGPNFPWDSYLAQVRAFLEGDSVTVDEACDKILARLDELFGIDDNGQARDIRAKIDANYIALYGADHPELPAGQLRALVDGTAPPKSATVTVGPVTVTPPKD